MRNTDQPARVLKKAIVDFYNWARSEFYLLRELPPAGLRRSSRRRTTISFKPIDALAWARTVWPEEAKEKGVIASGGGQLSGEYWCFPALIFFRDNWENRQNLNVEENLFLELPNFEIAVDSKSKEFRRWGKSLSGFESTIIHEMLHLVTDQQRANCVPYTGQLDWLPAEWDDGGDYDVDYANSIIMMGELLDGTYMRKSHAGALLQSQLSHHLEFFVSCYRVAMQIEENRKLRAKVFPDRKRYPRDRWARLRMITNEIYSYTVDIPRERRMND